MSVTYVVKVLPKAGAGPVTQGYIRAESVVTYYLELAPQGRAMADLSTMYHPGSTSTSSTALGAPSRTSVTLTLSVVKVSSWLRTSFLPLMSHLELQWVSGSFPLLSLNVFTWVSLQTWWYHIIRFTSSWLASSPLKALTVACPQTPPTMKRRPCKQGP